MKYIDTHTHYNDKVYRENLEEVLEKVKKANVTKMINVGYDEESSKFSIDLAKKYDQFYSSIRISSA